MLIRTYVSKEDVCGDDHVRVCKHDLYKRLLSIPLKCTCGWIWGKPPSVDMFQRFGQDTFMPKSVETSSGVFALPIPRG